MLKKLYFGLASLKLRRYEKVLNHCDQILTISDIETEYFEKKYGDKVTFLPAFHPNPKLHELSKKGYFALYHGNLNVLDNMKTAFFLIDIFKSIPYPLAIAGQTNDKKLLAKVDQYKNISFIPIENNHQLTELFHRAHVNVLHSFNNSGVKLKLINALFQSRFVITNQQVVEGSSLNSLCIMANNKKEIINQVLKIIEKDFSKEDLDLRKEKLAIYNNQKNAEILLNLL